LSAAARRRAARKAAVHLARAAIRWNARHIAVFLGMAEEIGTAALISMLWRQGCVLYVPKLAAAGRLRFAQLNALAPLRRNRYGIAEPVLDRRPARLDLILLPLVAFDDQGRRLGMGGGYYDRLLERARRRPLRVGFAFAAQEVAAVPAAARDVRLDAIVTERGLRRFR
jgi:5-formyltetrahydrofolate cyclo-ligase